MSVVLRAIMADIFRSFPQYRSQPPPSKFLPTHYSRSAFHFQSTLCNLWSWNGSL